MNDSLFIESGPFYVEVKNNQFVQIVFDKSLVPPAHVHLLGASAAMYGSLGEIYAHTEKLSTALDDITRTSTPEAQAGLQAIVNFLKTIQDKCLHIRHLAQIGTDEMAKLTLAQEKA